MSSSMAVDAAIKVEQPESSTSSLTTTTTNTTTNTTSSSTAATTSSSVEQKAEARIADNEYDVAAWKVLFRTAQDKPIQTARAFYTRFFAKFPTAASYWALYADHEVKGS